MTTGMGIVWVTRPVSFCGGVLTLAVLPTVCAIVNQTGDS